MTTASQGASKAARTRRKRRYEALIKRTEAKRAAILYQLTTKDVEIIIGRELRPEEASSVRKTLEVGLNEEAAGLILIHFEAERS